MTLIVGGHQRSGTTLLFRLLRRHPQVGLTGEFRSFARLNEPYPTYVASLRKNWYARGILRNIGRRLTFRSALARLESGLFLRRYLAGLHPFREGRIGLAEVETALRASLPHTRYVGDKNPGYVFRLPKLARVPGLRRVIIYRDGRDVVSSMLVQLRTHWQDLPVAQEWSDTAKLAARWVRAVERMQEFEKELFILRYETLVENPVGELARLAQWLEVEAAGFPAGMIRPTSVGKHQSRLTSEELDTVLRVAGPTLARLGYT